MSEKILDILMQLFAIIANPQADDTERRRVVEAFLYRLISQDFIGSYLTKYDEAYEEAKKRLERVSSKRREGAIAVRIWRLCIEINEQGSLDHEQRIFAVIQALEFCKSGGKEINEMELGFIRTLAEGLNITRDEYDLIEKFVLTPLEIIPDSPNFLLIDGARSCNLKETKHLFKEQLKGQIWILYIPSVNIYFLRYRGSGELTMSVLLLQEDKIYPLSVGSSIRGYKVKPIYYWDVTMQFLSEEFQSSRVVYEVNNLEYRFRSGEIAIHHMSFKTDSGRMIGIMGASGAGKSTLLSVLNGSNRPSDGEVLINGVNIYDEKEKIKGLIGFVSQDDLLIEELTVFDNLYYNARLCFGNLNDHEIIQKVDGVLKNLGLYEIRNMKVGSPLNKKISGGQRKRLNISLELIREPSILFLDEPTSGLSSRDSENILDLLKDLTRKGKLLFVVIHQPSSDIFKMFDKLLVLDTGGYLVYNGNPVESIDYFKRKIEQTNYNESECYVCGNVNPDQIFNILETRVYTESGQPTDIRRKSPEDWYKLYKSEKKDDELEPGVAIPDINFKIPDKIKQLIVFVKRDILSKISDIQYLLITFFEAPLLAFFLAYLIRYFDESAVNPRYTLYENANLPIYIFMSVIVAIFMGLTLSAEEIIKDRKILKREAFLNLSWNSYLLSKVFVQFGISAIQALTFVIIGNQITGIRGMLFDYWLMLFTCWAGANIMGLVISDSFKAVVTIYILIPFLVIPQIILSGVLVKFEKLNPNVSSPVSIPFYGEMITARWGYEALSVRQFKDNKFEKQFYYYDKAMSQAKFKKDYLHAEIKGRLENIKTDLERGTSDENTFKKLLLVYNEFSKQAQETPDFSFKSIDYLIPGKVTPEIIEDALNYNENIRKYYVACSNNAKNRKDALVTKLQSADSKAFLDMRDNYANEALEEFVINKNETEKIIEYHDEIIQKLDPIYMDPKHNFIQSHFYSPAKRIFGMEMDTYWVNLIVLWFINLISYLLLYFRILKKLFDSGDAAMESKHKSSVSL